MLETYFMRGTFLCVFFIGGVVRACSLNLEGNGLYDNEIWQLLSKWY